MGWLKNLVLGGSPEQRKRKKELERKAKDAEWEAYKRARLERAKREGIEKGKAYQPLGKRLVKGLSNLTTDVQRDVGNWKLPSEADILGFPQAKVKRRKRKRRR